MIQRDYLMRMIEHLGRILARILGERKSGDLTQAQATTESAFGDLLGIDFSLISSLSAHDIAELMGLSRDASMGGMKCVIAARLLKERAEIQARREQDPRTADPALRKALELYLDGLLNIGYTEMDLTSHYADVKETLGRIGDQLPADLMVKAHRMYFTLREFDKAEDWLFRLKAAGHPDAERIGKEFFRELAGMDDERLRTGGMTRQEVEEGLEDFVRG